MSAPELGLAPLPAIERLRRAVAEVVRGKPTVVDHCLTAILAGGHILLEDVPGVGKTTLASAIAAALGGNFSRIQFTSDLLPSDLTGINVLDTATASFSFRAGPLFANVVLADELNRTSPKTQSALFEAMEEHQVSVDGQTRQLPQPFLVVATQNPFDAFGTFQLPDSQLDRFMMRLSLGYPDRKTEREILRRGAQRPRAEQAVTPAEMADLAESAMGIDVPELVEEYLLDVVAETRRDARLLRGVSTRGAAALHRAVRARARVADRPYVVPEDVSELAIPVLAHRVLPRASATRGSAEAAIAGILAELPSPL